MVLEEDKELIRVEEVVPTLEEVAKSNISNQ